MRITKPQILLHKEGPSASAGDGRVGWTLSTGLDKHWDKVDLDFEMEGKVGHVLLDLTNIGQKWTEWTGLMLAALVWVGQSQTGCLQLGY